MAFGLRELVTVVSFRVNRGQLAAANGALRRVSQSAAQIGRNMSLFATLPLALGAKGLLGAATNIDLVRKSLDGMLGSAEAGQRVMDGLFELARESPLVALKDVGKAAKTLIAQGFGERGLVETMKLLSTAASAFGSDLSLLSRNYAQVRAANRLMGRDLKDFENQMIPITGALAKVLNVPASGIRKMASESKIPFSAVEKAFRLLAGEGSKAAKIVEAIANTPFGKFAKFKDLIFEVSARLGKKLFPATIRLIALGTKLVEMFDRLSGNTKRFVLILGAVTAAIGPLALVIAGLALIFNLPTLVLLTLIGLLALFLDDLHVWRKGGKSLLGKIFGPWQRFWNNMTDAFQAFKQNWNGFISGFMTELRQLKELLDSIAQATGFKAAVNALFPKNLPSRATIRGTANLPPQKPSFLSNMFAPQVFARAILGALAPNLGPIISGVAERAVGRAQRNRAERFQGPLDVKNEFNLTFTGAAAGDAAAIEKTFDEKIIPKVAEVLGKTLQVQGPQLETVP